MPFLNRYMWTNIQDGSQWTHLDHERQLLEKYASDHVMCISGVWFSWDDMQPYINEFLNSDSKNKVIVFFNVDPGVKPAETNDRILVLGPSDFWYWLHILAREFRHALCDLENVTYKALCYQRKPHLHRLHLYDCLSDLPDIFITCGTRDYDTSMAHNVPDYKEIYDVHIPEEYTNKLPPHDIYSLGNQDIWNSSFLNIVSESFCWYDQSNPYTPFFSEKTIKPLVGKRPFLIYGINEKISSDFLKKHGFETFEQEFCVGEHYNIDSQSNSIRVCIQDLKKESIMGMYQDLKEKIDHNYHNFHRAAQCDQIKLDNIVAEFLNTR
jgi:hypothetical protein